MVFVWFPAAQHLSKGDEPWWFGGSPDFSSSLFTFWKTAELSIFCCVSMQHRRIHEEARKRRHCQHPPHFPNREQQCAGLPWLPEGVFQDVPGEWSLYRNQFTPQERAGPHVLCSRHHSLQPEPMLQHEGRQCSKELHLDDRLEQPGLFGTRGQLDRPAWVPDGDFDSDLCGRPHHGGLGREPQPAWCGDGLPEGVCADRRRWRWRHVAERENGDRLVCHGRQSCWPGVREAVVHLQWLSVRVQGGISGSCSTSSWGGHHCKWKEKLLFLLYSMTWKSLCRAHLYVWWHAQVEFPFSLFFSVQHWFYRAMIGQHSSFKHTFVCLRRLHFMCFCTSRLITLRFWY